MVMEVAIFVTTQNVMKVNPKPRRMQQVPPNHVRTAIAAGYDLRL